VWKKKKRGGKEGATGSTSWFADQKKKKKEEHAATQKAEQSNIIRGKKLERKGGGKKGGEEVQCYLRRKRKGEKRVCSTRLLEATEKRKERRGTSEGFGEKENSDHYLATLPRKGRKGGKKLVLCEGIGGRGGSKKKKKNATPLREKKKGRRNKGVNLLGTQKKPPQRKGIKRFEKKERKEGCCIIRKGRSKVPPREGQ